MILKKSKQSAIALVHYNSILLGYFTAKKHGVITLFTIASIAAADAMIFALSNATISAQARL